MVITHQSKTVQVSLIFQLWNSTNGGQTACMAIKITLTALDPPVCHWPRSGQLTVLIWSAIKKKMAYVLEVGSELSKNIPESFI